MFSWLNRYFLSEDESEISKSDLVWWYGVFGGSTVFGLIMLVIFGVVGNS